MLVANGHRYDDVIHHYPIPLLHLMASLASKRVMAEMRVNALSMRMAQAKPKDWKTFIKIFETTDLPDPSETPADAFVRALKKNKLWHSLRKSQSESG
jgi:hypothetical protein